MEWIRVEDRLPEQKESDGYELSNPVLILVDNNKQRVGFYDLGDWYIFVGVYMTDRVFPKCRVTHWMPLPEIPELQKEE